MVVHDEKTRRVALDMMQRCGRVYYTDEIRYSSVVPTLEALDSMIQQAFSRGDIAIVAETIDTIPYHGFEKKRIFQMKRQQELRNVRLYISDHPDKVAKIMARNS